MTDSIKFEVRQFVRLCNERGVFVKLGEHPTERLAKISFASFCKDFPAEYFELVRVSHIETCLNFSTNKNWEELDLLG